MRADASTVKICAVTGLVYLLTRALPTFNDPPGEKDVSSLASMLLIAVAKLEKFELIVILEPAMLSLPRISVIVTVAILF
jgi:hypothetical protein